MGPAEAHWQRAFAALDGLSAAHSSDTERLLGGLSLAVHAHVESDLPRSLAEVYVDHFAKHCDYARFRGDYYGMGSIFVDAFRRVLDVIPSQSLPAWARMANRTLPAQFMQQLAYRKAYDLPKHRRAAFRRGAEIAEVLLRRQSDPQPFNQ